jgi:hypothetical protein
MTRVASVLVYGEGSSYGSVAAEALERIDNVDSPS